jgi:integrase
MRAKRERLIKYQGVYVRTSETKPKVNGRQDVCYDISYKDARGKKIWECVGWASKGITAAYASQLRAERVRDVRLSGEVVPIQQRRKQALSFGDLAERYLEWAKSSKKDWSHDEGRYKNHLKSELAGKLLNDISPLDLERLKKKLQTEGLSPATVKHCLVIVRQMFNKAIAWGFFKEENPVRKIGLPKISNRRQRFLSYEEADQLLEHLDIRDRDTHDLALVSLHCGLRFGEIAALTWGDIDFVHDIISVRFSKSGEKREAYLTFEVKAVLEARMPQEARASDFIFTDDGGRPLRAAPSFFKTAVKHLKFNEYVDDRSQKVVFHTLRHTFASWLAMEGATLLEIKELLGHASTVMTERYSHLIPDRKRAAVMRLAEIFDQTRQNRANPQPIEQVEKSDI